MSKAYPRCQSCGGQFARLTLRTICLDRDGHPSAERRVCRWCEYESERNAAKRSAREKVEAQ